MSRRFVFRLQPVLEQRERVERDAQLRVAEIEREKIALEDKLRSCQERITLAKHELREHMGGGASRAIGGSAVSVEAVRLQSHASLHLVAMARRAVLELAGVMERLRSARNELGRVSAARKAVTLLKERQYAEWKLTLARQEAAELDEMMVMRHGRKDTDS